MSLRNEQARRIETGRFNHKELAVITTRPDAIKWINNEEFLYQGNMYDLVSYSEQYDVWQIAALKDTKEDALKHAYEKSMDADAQQGHPKAQPLKLIIAPCILPIPAARVLVPAITMEYKQAEVTACNFLSQNIISPPPEA